MKKWIDSWYEEHTMGLGIDWSNQLANELHKPVRRRFEKRTVFAKQVNDIWTADVSSDCS